MLASLPLLPASATLWQDNSELLIVFGFVLCLVLVRRIFRHQRARMWHETARIALEKGQPVPAPELAAGCGARGFGRSSAWWEIRRGFVLLAISAGLYFALGEDHRAWVAIPACIGAANLVLGLISYRHADAAKDREDPVDQP
jgi:hypothetical protein